MMLYTVEHYDLFSNDQQQQEQLIEKYMMLPNQVWDDIINQVIFVHLSVFSLKELSSYSKKLSSVTFRVTHKG